MQPATGTSSALERSDLERTNANMNRLNPREVPELVTRYINQLINGCENNDCREVLCRTGIPNTSPGRPARQYTTRSARTIAISICATPSPRAHLCRYMAATSAVGRIEDAQGPVDPSALDQLLSETQSLKLLQDPEISCLYDSELSAHHEHVSRLLKAAGQDPSLPEGFLSNAQLVEALIPSTEWLLSKLPLRRRASFKMVNDIISKGFAYPPKNASYPVDDSFNNWLTILDTLHHKPYLRLLGQIVRTLAVRQAVELAIQERRKELGMQSCTKASASSCITLFWKLLLGADQQSPDQETAKCNILGLILWIKRLAAEHWDGRPLVRIGSICMTTWSLLSNLMSMQMAGSDPIVPATAYVMPMIWVRLTTTELATSYRETSTYGSRTGLVHMLHFRELFTAEQLTLCFRSLNHLSMRSAHSHVEKTVNLMKRYDQDPDELTVPEQSTHSTKYYLLLNVSRGNILRDTFDQLWQRRKDELKRPLRVRLGEVEEYEIGHDLGGVQIEFFNLVCKAILSEEADMFITDTQSEFSYFKPGSLQPLYMFELFGLLLALAIYNGITLPINLPWAFYSFLLGEEAPTTPQEAVDYIRDGWPVLAKSMQSVLDEDIPGLENTFPFEANGMRMQTHWPRIESIIDETTTLPVSSTTPEVDLEDIAKQLPGWTLVKSTSRIEDVTPENKGEYVKTYIKYITYASLSPQWLAFKRGFEDSSILDMNHLKLFNHPIQLKYLIEGTSQLDIAALRRITQYDGFHPNDPYMHSFWRVVGSWSEAKQKQLLKFVTAAERIPITGNLTFVIKRFLTEDQERLPTSSTCFGTLMLPVYRSERVLGQKLSLALKYGTEGFGTG